MSNNAVPLQEPVPLPMAYTRQIAYDYSKNQYYNPNLHVENHESKRDTVDSTVTEVDSLESKRDNEKIQEEDFATAKFQKSILMHLRNSRFYIRAFAVLVMISSLSLIVTAVVMFSKAKKQPGNPLGQVPQPAPITDRPCIVFSGVAAMNLILSLSVFWLGCASSKFRKSNDAINAVFTIISAVGFATAMGACFFLNKESTLQNDLWKWSCGNHAKGINSDALDFNLVCNVVSYGWKLGLVQASLELLTFIISVTAFLWLKYSYFARYGRVGKLF